MTDNQHLTKAEVNALSSVWVLLDKNLQKKNEQMCGKLKENCWNSD